jgi:hypothetical protein
MKSKRIYPQQRCINPDCKKSFHPHDYRQQFCNAQCRTNYYNDKRREDNLGRYCQEEILRRNDFILEVLNESEFYKDEEISEEILKGFAINMAIGTLEENLLTRRPIRWYHSYGLELINTTDAIYTIHYRTKIDI